MPKTEIIDLSHHQGNLQFGDIKAAGVKAVILKATDGVDYVDPKFTEYVTRARAKGLLVGAYHFMSAQNPEAQLEHFLRTVKPYRPLLLCLDFEANSFRGNPTAEILTTMVHGMVKELGRHPVLYGSDGSYLGPLLASKRVDPQVAGCERWVARYGPFKPKTPCSIWQYSSSGKVQGYAGRLDVNAFVSKNFPTVEAYWKRWEI